MIAKFPVLGPAKAYFGKTPEGVQYKIAEQPQCYECMGIAYPDIDKLWLDTGLCNGCYTPGKHAAMRREESERVSWLQDAAFKRHILQQSEALR